MYIFIFFFVRIKIFIGKKCSDVALNTKMEVKNKRNEGDGLIPINSLPPRNITKVDK